MRLKLNYTAVLLTTLLIILVLPLLSAQMGSPVDALNNEWVKFGIIFILLFAGIYTFTKNRTHGNTAVSLVVGACLSLLLTIAVIKRGLLDSFLEETIVDTILIVCTIIIIFFVIYWIYNKLGKWGMLLIILILAWIPSAVDLQAILPQAFLYGPFEEFLLILIDWSSWIAAAIIIYSIIMLVRWIRKGKQPKAPGVNVNVNQPGGGMSPRQRRKMARAQQKQMQRLEVSKRRRDAHRMKRANRPQMHQANVNRRLSRKYGYRT